MHRFSSCGTQTGRHVLANYEFNDDQNKVIDELSSEDGSLGFICVIGTLYVVLGHGFGALFECHAVSRLIDELFLANGLATILIGPGRSAADPRSKVVETRGNDIGTLWTRSANCSNSTACNT